jgi:hypothetical protein
MTCTLRRWLVAVALFLALLAPSSAMAGPYFGDWTWFWHPSPDCPRGEYSPLHYQAPEIYRVRALVHPSNIDQYPQGPTACPTVNYEFSKYRCRSNPPMPTAPYADPAGYFGRPVGLPFALP